MLTEPDYLTGAKLQKISSAASVVEPDQKFLVHHALPFGEPDSFDLEQQAEQIAQKTGAGFSYPRSPLEHDGVQLNF